MTHNWREHGSSQPHKQKYLHNQERCQGRYHIASPKTVTTNTSFFPYEIATNLWRNQRTQPSRHVISQAPILKIFGTQLRHHPKLNYKVEDF